MAAPVSQSLASSASAGEAASAVRLTAEAKRQLLLLLWGQTGQLAGQVEKRQVAVLERHGSAQQEAEVLPWGCQQPLCLHSAKALLAAAQQASEQPQTSALGLVSVSVFVWEVQRVL